MNLNVSRFVLDGMGIPCLSTSGTASAEGVIFGLAQPTAGVPVGHLSIGEKDGVVRVFLSTDGVFKETLVIEGSVTDITPVMDHLKKYRVSTLTFNGNAWDKAMQQWDTMSRPS